MINNDLALANGNDVRVYFLKEEDCQPREVDRILENTGTTTARVLFKTQEDFNKTVLEKSAYFLVYGNNRSILFSKELKTVKKQAHPTFYMHFTYKTKKVLLTRIW